MSINGSSYLDLEALRNWHTLPPIRRLLQLHGASQWRFSVVIIVTFFNSARSI
jgi:hypothetical protein